MRCGEAKPLDDFHRNAAKRDGRQDWCRACKNAHHKTYYEAHREKFVKAADGTQRRFRQWYEGLKKGPCVDCGQQFPPQVMHWHHTDPDTKDAHVGRLARTGSKTAVLREVEKCVLLCANCHALRH
jgi:hypothetical protein